MIKRMDAQEIREFRRAFAIAGVAGFVLMVSVTFSAQLPSAIFELIFAPLWTATFIVLFPPLFLQSSGKTFQGFILGLLSGLVLLAIATVLPFLLRGIGNHDFAVGASILLSFCFAAGTLNLTRYLRGSLFLKS